MAFSIYCDMDGVLVDFEKGAKKIYPPFKSGMEDWEKKHFWNLISKQGISFWANLPWLAGGKYLWECLKEYKPYILSAYTEDKFSSTEGKRIWVTRNLSNNVQVILVKSEEKARYAKFNSILIDDREELITDWTLAGGIGIHHTNLVATLVELDNHIALLKKVSRSTDAKYLHPIDTF